MKRQKDLEGMKTAFIGYDASFKEQTPPDIQLKPLDDETPMPAHKSVLATRSKILGIPNLDGSYLTSCCHACIQLWRSKFEDKFIR